MRMSVLVPSYKRPQDLARCLAGLARQKRAADQVVVVARRTDADTIDTVKRFAPLFSPGKAPDIVLVDRPGVIHAMSSGLDRVTGEVVAITDDDAIPHADWLERIEAAFAGSLKTAGVGGRDLIPGELGGPGELHERVGVVQWWGRVVGNHHLGCGGPRKVHVLKGVNCAYRTALLRQVGFGRGLKGAGAQVHFELGIGLDLIARGWSLVYDPAILVDHFPAPRQDYDKRNSFNPRAVSDAVHNETVLLLRHLTAPRRLAMMAWSLACGTRAAPGLVGLALEARANPGLAADRWRATLRGRIEGYRSWRSLRSVGGQPVAVGS
ncbi:glycosyltransferase involved in cell wall biosynthesis [Skermanella aerolata]|uniref:Glycosyl transferase n=1 Tax=Skermanella aerolata TaxID=393310 RepID=A0A512E1H8_9PROT|nr:glycosyltransferase [Skermanella aerolata]KJB91438.1 glycosyl transferase [Skermanella aerolata KACC 11604]GEO42574.1 glycosyl transferase [Skermanella aerolata]